MALDDSLATTAPEHASMVEAITAVDSFFDGVFESLEDWLPTLEEHLRPWLDERALTGARLVDMFEDEVNHLLDTTPRPLYGAGACLIDDLVASGNPLSWWQGPERGLLPASTFGPGQAMIDLYRLEWFRVPQETHRRHIAGPFVDYLCSHEITITSSLPILIDDRFIGVACADVLVTNLEKEILPRLSRTGEVVLVNADERVVLSTGFEYETGDRYGGSADVETVTSSRYPFALHRA